VGVRGGMWVGLTANDVISQSFISSHNPNRNYEDPKMAEVGYCPPEYHLVFEFPGYSPSLNAWISYFTGCKTTFVNQGLIASVAYGDHPCLLNLMDLFPITLESLPPN
jgi:hypothetical protein